MYASFPFGFEGGIWDLIILIPDHCFSIYSFLLYLFFYGMTFSLAMVDTIVVYCRHNRDKYFLNNIFSATIKLN